MTFLKKNLNLSLEEKRAAVEYNHPSLSLTHQASLLGLSKGALYYEPVKACEYNLKLMDLIDQQYLKTPFYGSRRMTVALGKMGYSVNRKRIQRLMRLMGLEGLAPGPNTSKPGKEHKIYPYLLRGLAINTPNHVWATDITYVRVLGGFIYLVAVMDWFSRYVLSWRISNTLGTGFCLEALRGALDSSSDKPSIFNMDQGCQFTSNAYTGALEEEQISISMDSKGRALDNIMVERLWRSVKYEEIYLKDYKGKTIKEAKENIKKYFEFYNENRPHQSLGYMTPKQVYYGEMNA